MMVLVDTSVWVDHLRHGNDRLAGLLNDGRVMCHPFVIGELACGNLRNRDEILKLLKALPGGILGEHTEVLNFVIDAPLSGRGLGWVDAHLLTSARLSEVPLWTLDRTLRREAKRLGVAF